MSFTKIVARKNTLLLTVWMRLHLRVHSEASQKLMHLQLFKKFPAFCRTRSFVSVFTRPHSLSTIVLSQTEFNAHTSMHILQSYSFKIHFNVLWSKPWSTNRLIFVLLCTHSGILTFESATTVLFAHPIVFLYSNHLFVPHFPEFGLLLSMQNFY